MRNIFHQKNCISFTEKMIKFKNQTLDTLFLALLAQLAEQLTLNQRVAGSSPAQGI